MKMDVKLSRRQFLKGAAIAGAGMALPLKFGVRDSYAYYQSPGLAKWTTTSARCRPRRYPRCGCDGYLNVPGARDRSHPLQDQYRTV